MKTVMRLLFKLFLWLLFLSPFVLAILFWLSLSEAPLVTEQPPMSRDDMLRAKAIIKQHRHQQSPDKPLQLVLGERDLELAGNYLLQRFTESGLEIHIQDDLLLARATLRVPGLPARPYLNLQLQLQDQQGEPNLVHLQVNDIVIPQALAKQLLAELLIQVYRTDEYRVARSIVDQIQLRNRQLRLKYYWSPELARRARATFLKEPRQLRQIYRAELRRRLNDVPSRPSLTRVLPDLFALARKRSQEGNPVEENRALLSVLGYWATGHRTLATDLLGRDAGPPLHFRASLHRRRDLAQHFLISAAIAANTDNTLATLAGTLKEVADADKGSGFSFVDLTADRAGARLGELAIASPADARRFQQLIAAGINENDILPDIKALTEGMDLEQFKRHYGDLDSPAYRKAVERIDRHIGQCRLYRDAAQYSVNS